MLQFILISSIVGLVAVDQLTKLWAVMALKGQEPIVLIRDVFEFFYTENKGAAFSMLEGQRWLFIAITLIVTAFVLVVLLRGKYARYKLLNISGCMIVAGGIGNLIDRIGRGYVIDFLYFKWIDFPVFNFADCCVTIGAALLLFFFFFIYKEEGKKPLSTKEQRDGDDAPKEAEESAPTDQT